MSSSDVVVVGLGAMGSATLYALAQRGHKVLGIDRYEPAHRLSSSYGESRVIRMAYFEDPAYVPLLRLAYQAWRNLEAYTGERVLTVTGIVEAGYSGAPLVEGSLRSALEHDIVHDVLLPWQVNRRFPAFSIPNGWECVYQPDGGVLLPEKAIHLFVKSAEALGATVLTRTSVQKVLPVGERVQVLLESGETIDAGSAVIAAGPWLRDLAPDIGGKMRLTRQPLMWFEPKEARLVRPEHMPVCFLQTRDDLVYCLPDVCGNGVKAASHRSGGELTTADEPRTELSDQETTQLRNAIEEFVPAAAGRIRQTHICVYTRSPDEHFVLGLHPKAPQIVLASPCSGHGFKFASVFGEIIADLSTTRTTDKPMGLFRPDRIPFG